MINCDVNELVICKDHYEDEYDFETAISKAIMLLLENGYVMTVRYDDAGLGIVVIEYETNDYGLKQPHWIFEDERCIVEQHRELENNQTQKSKE